MEGDSVHSTVERLIENVDVHLPSQYTTLSKLARKAPMLYRAIYLQHSFFKNYADDQFMAYKSIRPGKAKGVTDITLQS